eukprot:2564245-Prymnesium_polylepis.1
MMMLDGMPRIRHLRSHRNASWFIRSSAILDFVWTLSATCSGPGPGRFMYVMPNRLCWLASAERGGIAGERRPRRRRRRREVDANQVLQRARLIYHVSHCEEPSGVDIFPNMLMGTPY